MPQPSELTPTEFRRRWPAGAGRDVTLLDVREPAELQIARVAEAIHIPMGEIPGRLAELDRDMPLVVMCRSGARSARVAQFLLANGFANVHNLAGGIDAWSREVDPRIPRY